jgi:serine protease Do
MKHFLTHVLALASAVAAAPPALASQEPSAPARLAYSPEVAVVERAGPAVVYIQTNAVTTVPDFFGRLHGVEQTGSGSGVVLFEEGYVITNYHVVKGAERIRLQFNPGYDARVYDASLLSFAEGEDLALLKIQGSEGPFPTVEMAADGDVYVGERVVAIGNPYGQTHTVSAGLVSALHRQAEIDGRKFENLIQTDAAINPGNSGGALLNLDGQLIGINSAMNVRAENIGFAIHVESVRRVLEEHLLSPDHARAWIGIDVDERSLYVTDVVPGSAADQSGVERGDRVVSVNGKSVQSGPEFRLARVEVEPNAAIALEVERAGARRAFTFATFAPEEGLIIERMGLVPEYFVLGNAHRLRVRQVLDGGPAADLGLQPGDVLDVVMTERGASWVADVQTVALLVSRLKPGAKLQADVWRDEDGDGRPEKSATASEYFRGTLTLR